MTKLLVAGGDELNTFEIVNLDDSNPFLVCDNITLLPGHSTSGIAFLYNRNKLMSCSPHGLCYSFEDGIWNDGPECPRSGVLYLSILLYPQIINLLLCVPPKQDSNTLSTSIGVQIGIRSYIDKGLEWAYFEEILNYAYPLVACLHTPGGTRTPG